MMDCTSVSLVCDENAIKILDHHSVTYRSKAIISFANPVAEERHNVTIFLQTFVHFDPIEAAAPVLLPPLNKSLNSCPTLPAPSQRELIKKPR
jgi:hypothetical protein